jgi:hypothetical protein
LPKFNFKLNVGRWREWQLANTGVDHSHHSPNILISVFSETYADAENTLDMVLDKRNFDLQETSKTTMYEVPGSCGTEHSK